MINKPIFVTAAIIKKNDKVLITKRKEDSILAANKWEFPGGKIEYLESPEECIIREIKEELDIKISIDKLFLITTHIYLKNEQKYHIILIVFLTDWIEGIEKNIECQDSKWINIENLLNYEFAEADIHIVQKLLHYSNP